MELNLTNKQMRMFVEIVQMVALLDESIYKYLDEFYSLSDAITVRKMKQKIEGKESACAQIEKIIKRNSSANKPMIEKMTQKFHDIKEIRNYIAHDRHLLVVVGINNLITNITLPLEDESEKTQDMSIEKLYEKASKIFEEFKDFLSLLYYEPDEKEYQAERRLDLYGK